MVEESGPKIWTEFVQIRQTGEPGCKAFGSLEVRTTLCAGDGGTFACHVKESVKRGSWSLYSLALEKTNVGVVLAWHQQSEPIRWEFAGGIIIDSSVGTFLTSAALKEIRDMEDGDELTDAIDEALFGSEDDEAILTTPKGKPFAVFQLGGDGTYNVIKGIDTEGATCVLAIIQP